MEEIAYKLTCNDPVLIAQTVSSLVELIREKSMLDVPSKGRKESPELAFLKKQCVSEDPVVSITACEGVKTLITQGLLSNSAIISDMVAALSTNANHLGVVSLVCDLLELELQSKRDVGSEYKCPYNLRIPQHPLNTILMQNPKSCEDAFNKLRRLLNCSNDCTRQNHVELFRPFYLYVLCDPDAKLPQAFRHKLWEFLIRSAQPQNVDLMCEIIGWIPITAREHLPDTCLYLLDVVRQMHVHQNKDLLEVVVLWLCSLLYELMSKKCDPCEVLHVLACILSSDALLVSTITDSMLLLLSSCITSCPSCYLLDLLQLCVAIVNQKLTNKYVLSCLKASLLHWLLRPCLLTKSSTQVIERLLRRLDSHITTPRDVQTPNELLEFLASTNEHVHFAMTLCALSRSFSECSLLEWLLSVEKVVVPKQMLGFLLGVLIADVQDVGIPMKALQILMLSSERCNLLTVVLFKLPHTRSPRLHLSLLKALPKLGALKENLQLVVNTLHVLAKGPKHLQLLAVELFYNLWETRIECYPLLQKLLREPPKNWEFYVVKARIVRNLCVKRPELYGTELVVHVSQILNECKSKDGALPSALVLEGLRHLCRECIIDIGTAWSTLAPGLDVDDRPLVLKTLCELMSEVPSLVEPTPKHAELVKQVVTKLWDLTIHSDHTEVKAAAYEALGHFSLEEISEHIPETYRDQNSPLVHLMTFNYIPGSNWLLVLERGPLSSIKAAGDLLIKLVTSEVSAYTRAIYEVREGHREPHNYNSLPPHSIVRALGNYVKQNISETAIYAQCLRVLSHDYPKPLPPLDWCFLQELLHVPELRFDCISIGAHQVVLSGTARRFIENLIVAITNSEFQNDDYAVVYKNFKHLANSIQPSIVKPFVVRSLEQAMAFDLDFVYAALSEIVANKDIGEVNKSVIAQVLVDSARDQKIQVLEKLLKPISKLPALYLKKLITCDASDEELNLAVRIRCYVAVNDAQSALACLNEALEAASSRKSCHSFVFARLAEVFQKRSCNWQWFSELLGQIQVNLIHDKYDSRQVVFFCDVFILAMVVFSGHYVLLEDSLSSAKQRLCLFPQSVRSLLASEELPYASQILEWLLHMIENETVPLMHRKAFYQAMAALKHEEAFKESYNWMKYVGTRVPK